MANDKGGSPDFFDDLDDLKLPSDGELPAPTPGRGANVGVGSEWLADIPAVSPGYSGRRTTAEPQGSEEAEPTAESTDTEHAEGGEKPEAAAEEGERPRQVAALPVAALPGIGRDWRLLGHPCVGLVLNF